MKKTILLFTAIFLSVFAFSQVNLNEGLVAYYPFNGNANDESGNGNDGTVNGANLTEDRFGNPNSAFYFDGVNDFISLPDEIVPLDKYSISLWVNIKDVSGINKVIIGQWDDVGDDKRSWAISYYYSGSSLQLWYMESSDGTINGYISMIFSSGTYSPNNWLHLVVNKNGSTINTYVNDNVEGSNSSMVSLNYNYPGNIKIASNDGFGGGGITYSNIHIDDLRIYNRNLNTAEIQALYTENQTSFTCGQPIADSRDGQTYQTVPIGNQCWMAENLNYESGNSWCYDNNSSNCNTYGRLYNWESAMSRCPNGWHLPSDEEWCTLTQNIDQTVNCNNSGWSGNDCGLKMKSILGWNQNGIGTNESGFSALPGGRRGNGSFKYLGDIAYFWSSTGVSDIFARHLSADEPRIHRDTDRSSFGNSVRCVKNEGAQSTNLQGTILDQGTSQPIEGAFVSLIPQVSNGTATTNQNGDWQMLNIQPGLGYDIEINRPGYETLQVSGLNFELGQTYTLDYQLTLQENFLDYRVVPVALAPNQPVLEIPEGGTGYAWYDLEGELTPGNWLPVPAAEIEIVDGQGNQVYDKNGDPVKVNFLLYKFLTAAYHMQNAGVFGVPIDSDIIQDGTVGSQEQIHIVGANGQAISEENQQSILAEVVPYYYTQSWGFRLYSKGGVGAGTLATGGTVKGNVFAGGGSGAAILLELEGLDSNPDWTKFQIHRRDDIFVGAEISIGPPSLINTGVGANAGLTASFPYQTDFAFDMTDLEGLEAALAFYIFYEPGILYATKTLPAGQVGINFLSWMVEALIANSAQNGLGIVRVADETGLDIEGSISLSADLGIGVTKSLGLSLGASAGASAHLGGSIKKTVNDEVFRRLYIGGGYDINVGIGPKILGNTKISSKFLYPYRLMQTTIPTSFGVQFGGIAKWQYGQWENLRLHASLESNSDALNIYNLPGNIQEYSAWLEIDNEDVKNLFLNHSEQISEVFNIGEAGVNSVINDNSFKDDVVSFMDTVYQEQNDDQPVTLKYGFDAYDRNEYSMDKTVQFPLPIFPALDIVIGGGLQSTKERSYKLAEGYWVKGLPYLQTEMPNPPQPQETFEGVMNELWGNVTAGNVWQELADVIVAHLTNKVVKWWPFKGDTQLTLLNPEGSTLEIRENSIPISIDSLISRHWEWGEVPATKSLDADQRKKYIDYVKGLRDLREAATGLHYGIGGFFRFEPAWEEFEDSTLLTIVYPDTAVSGFDETELHMFWEDTLGIWHPLESTIMPDSNKVSAWINHFTTYTLAPTLPQGNYGLQTNPDSIPANGSSTALVYSETLLNNDSTIIENGLMFTVESTRGSITSIDMDAEKDGIQVELMDGTIQFEVKADSIPTPITLTAKSAMGFAVCETQLVLFDTVQPSVPTNIEAVAHHKSIQLAWEGVSMPDLAGYKIYFDTDTIIPPYNGVSTVWGEPSPISVGVTDEHLIVGLFPDTTYFIAVTAVDIAGNESEYSVPIECKPFELSQQKIEISAGWSGISAYLDPETENMEYVFGGIINDLIILQNGTDVYWPEQGVNTIGDWNTHEGYLIKVANTVELNISGVRENNRTLQLAEGWNLIPVLSECPVNVEDFDLIMAKEVAGWKIYWPAMGINTLDVLEPGKAYFIKMENAAEFVFPECD